MKRSAKAAAPRLVEWIVTTTPEFPLALCTDVDPDIFFPHPHDREGFFEAMSICLGCVHRNECAEFAIEHEITDGVFGGLGPEQRRLIRKRGTTA